MLLDSDPPCIATKAAPEAVLIRHLSLLDVTRIFKTLMPSFLSIFLHIR
jgi:hypothetical protein